MLISNQIKFGLFIFFQIPSILCHLFLIYHLINNRQLRQTLRHRVILIFLIINFLLITIDLSIILHFLRHGHLAEDQVNLCVAWNFIDTFLSNSAAFLMMWASIERHLLIFYARQLYNTNLKRLIFHYFPPIFLIIYSFIFYSIAIYIYPNCTNKEQFNYEVVFCGRACYIHANFLLSTIDLFLNRITCSIVILIFNLLLLIRVLYEKKQRNQIIRWHRHRKMAIQVLSISTLYLLGTLPTSIAELIHIFQLNSKNKEESPIQEEIFLYLFYVISLFIPFICLISLPEISFRRALERSLNRTPHRAFSVGSEQVKSNRRTAAVYPA